MKVFENILQIQQNYKGFILDVWGVLHASGVVYKGVTQSLTTLKKEGKKILLLSNAPRRSVMVSAFLKQNLGLELGIHYDGILTSGEAFFKTIENQNNIKNVFYIGPERDLGVVKSEKIKLTSDIKECDFAVITGIVSEPENILRELKKYNKQLYCINPDIFVTKSDGSREECAGFIASKYQEIGGDVVYFGKPHSEVYKEAMNFFNGFTKDEILAVGDGMETDILGASSFNISSALCLAGLPSVELVEGISISTFLAKYKVKPDFIIASL